jgi:hypothetical protein
MPVHVYECDQSEAQKLKKLIAYDPYLDSNLIPKTREVDPKELEKMSPEDRKKIEDQDAAAKAASEKLRNDPMMNVIFARQDTDLREGRALGLNDDKYYLYLKATDEFLKLADEKLSKEFTSVKRASAEIEKKFIAVKEDEESRANAGFGAIFGG